MNVPHRVTYEICCVHIRLAEQYKTSLASKEKILKGIEVKKEYLGNLRPGLQAIMQVMLTDALAEPETNDHLIRPMY